MAKKKAKGIKKFLNTYRLEIGVAGLVLLLWGIIWAWDSNLIRYITPEPSIEEILDDQAASDADEGVGESSNPGAATDTETGSDL